MPQIVYTVTKENSSDPWIIAQAPYAEACCTEEEMNNTILPYRQAVASLPGLVGMAISESSDTTLEITYTFDTNENRDSCIFYLTNEQSGRKELMAAKRQAANLNFTLSGIIS